MQVGDYVLKGTDVYTIDDMREESIANMPARNYYILSPAYETKHHLGGTSYVPVDKADMTIRPVPTKEEVADLFVQSEEGREFKWIDNRNKRINAARSILSSGDLVDIIKLERLYHKRYEFVEAEDKSLSGKDNELATRGFELIVHVVAASHGISAEEAESVAREMLL
ncbi:MAG: CarD family transcriptional regulator [Eggerthellaceae bacterium]|jgi:RNA polymerase-interacting CarD/CdnL/TRCF family regulator